MRYLSEFVWTNSLDFGTLVLNNSRFLIWSFNISVLSGLNLLHLNTIVSPVGHLLRPLVLLFKISFTWCWTIFVRFPLFLWSSVCQLAESHIGWDLTPWQVPAACPWPKLCICCRTGCPEGGQPCGVWSPTFSNKRIGISFPHSSHHPYISSSF